MATKAGNENLRIANKAKKDEFYTQLSDIEKEIRHYKEHLKNKVVLCNCDDPRISNFFHYFSYNFERAIYLEYNGDKNGDNVPSIEEIGIKYLKGDGNKVYQLTENVHIFEYLSRTKSYEYRNQRNNKYGKHHQICKYSQFQVDC